MPYSCNILVPNSNNFRNAQNRTDQFSYFLLEEENTLKCMKYLKRERLNMPEIIIFRLNSFEYSYCSSSPVPF